MKRIFLLLLLSALLLCSCKSKSSEPVVDMTAPVDLAPEEAVAAQLAGPQSGDTVVTMTVQGFGDIKIRFFPEDAPKAVENFLTLAEQGYYRLSWRKCLGRDLRRRIHRSCPDPRSAVHGQQRREYERLTVFYRTD